MDRDPTTLTHDIGGTYVVPAERIRPDLPVGEPEPPATRTRFPRTRLGRQVLREARIVTTLPDVKLAIATYESAYFLACAARAELKLVRARIRRESANEVAE